MPKGTGSGFIWGDAGHVVTNYHVIENASGATIKLADGRAYKAALIGTSPAHDIAVLRIDVGFKLSPPAPVGISHDLKVARRFLPSATRSDWTGRWPTASSQHSIVHSPEISALPLNT